MPALLAFAMFQGLALWKKARCIFKWGDYLYYLVAAVGVGLFYVGEYNQVSHYNDVLTAAGLDGEIAAIRVGIQALQERLAYAERRRPDEALVASCPPLIKGQTETNVQDPKTEKCREALKLANELKFLPREIDHEIGRLRTVSAKRASTPDARLATTDPDLAVKFIFSPMLLLVAIMYKLGHTTATLVGGPRT